MLDVNPMHFDTLTDLPNREYFNNLVDSWTTSIPDSKHLISLVLVNVDSLKSIRDSYGADGGDDMLQLFSQRLISVFEENHTSTADEETKQEAPL